MAVTYRAPERRLSLLQGVLTQRQGEIAYDAADLAAGLYTGFDFTGWTARADIYDEDETLIVSFATSGEDGVITLGTHGEMDFSIDPVAAAALPATVAIAGVIHAPFHGHVITTAPDGTPYWDSRITLEIGRNPEP